ncbi:hypothetical protein BBJ28_00019071 [Nothophytophthora sp. Chile5]|nr:hypothetical protein BBJ28_00019071 [Nothophytophthora sp. Chile5]
MDASYEDAIVLGQEWSTLLGDSSDDKDAESNSHGSNSGNTLHSDTPRDQIAEEYIASLTNDSGLHLVEEAQIRKAYRDGGEVGLFSLFITHKFKDTIRQWTNEQLVKQGRRATTPSEFDAYLGLELAMSICPLNDITEFWSERRFLGQPDFDPTEALFQFIEGRRLMVSDSFYTRHLLAKALLKFTDGEVGTLGTGRLNLVDKWNKVKLTEAAKRVEGMNRGSWELVAAVDAEVGWKRKEDEHKKAQKQLPKEQQTPYNASVVISPRAE